MGYLFHTRLYELFLSYKIVWVIMLHTKLYGCASNKITTTDFMTIQFVPNVPALTGTVFPHHPFVNDFFAEINVLRPEKN